MNLNEERCGHQKGAVVFEHSPYLLCRLIGTEEVFKYLIGYDDVERLSQRLSTYIELRILDRLVAAKSDFSPICTNSWRHLQSGSGRSGKLREKSSPFLVVQDPCLVQNRTRSDQEAFARGPSHMRAVEQVWITPAPADDDLLIVLSQLPSAAKCPLNSVNLLSPCDAAGGTSQKLLDRFHQFFSWRES